MLADTCLPQPTAVASPRVVFQTRVLTSLSDVLVVLPAWHDLQEKSGCPCLRLSAVWLTTWFQTFPQAQPLFIEVRLPSGQLAALAPFQAHPSYSRGGLWGIKTISLVGTAPQALDAASISYDPDMPLPWMMLEVAKALLSVRQQWQVLWLNRAADQAPLELLQQFLTGYVAATRLETVEGIPITEWSAPGVPARTGGGKFRRELKRMRSRLQVQCNGQAPVLHVIDDPQQRQAYLDLLFRRHQAFWKRQHQSTEFSRIPALKTFFQAMATQSEQTKPNGPTPLVSVLQAGETILSIHMGMAQGNVYWGQVSTYDEAYKRFAPGIIHLNALTDLLFSRGFSRLCLGQGEAAYKGHWATHTVPCWRLTVLRTSGAKHRMLLDQLLRWIVKGHKPQWNW